MKKLNKTHILTFLGIAVICLSLGMNVVYAATSAKLSLCEYAGTLRTFKILGIVLNILKIAIPLLISITGIVAFVKPLMSGKSDDVKASAFILFKKVIAGLVIFLIPTVMPTVFEMLIPNYDDSEIYACSTCLLDVDNCQIPTSDPVTYTD